jgi:hypothetical protein
MSEVIKMISKLGDLVFYIIVCAFFGVTIFALVQKLAGDDVVEYESWSRRECVFIEVNGVKKPCEEMPAVETWEHVWVE